MRRAVLAHEFAHIRRNDTLISALARLVKSVFWFHPLAWWLSRKVSELAELSCDAVMKATQVDGVYSADPKKDPSATRYATLTFDQAIAQNLGIMDATAFALCRDQNLPIKVFSIFKNGALKRVVLGSDEGTLVHC